MADFVVQLHSDSQAITAAGGAVNKGRLPQDELEECFVPESD